MEDARILALLRVELDRREVEAQALCPHRRSGTLYQDLEVKCDQCGKYLGQEDVDNAFGGIRDTGVSALEQRHVEGKV